MQLAAGAVVDGVDVPGVGRVEVRYSRADDGGWWAGFTLTAPGVVDLAVQHRLAAPTLGEARRQVPAAARFLAGLPVDPVAPA